MLHDVKATVDRCRREGLHHRPETGVSEVKASLNAKLKVLYSYYLACACASSKSLRRFTRRCLSVLGSHEQLIPGMQTPAGG